MVTEDYCSYEIAKLLKEKGFDGECTTGYFNERLIDYTLFGFCDGEILLTPTLQMVMKWLREVHKKYIEICVDTGYIYGDVVFKSAIYNNDLDCVFEPESFPTYEEAVNAAIKYCLTNLI